MQAHPPLMKYIKAVYDDLYLCPLLGSIDKDED